MEKRLVVAIVLFGAVLFVWYGYLFPPPERPPGPPPGQAPLEETIDFRSPEPERDPAGGTDDATAPSPDDPGDTVEAVAAAAEQEIRIENGVFEVLLSNRGGSVRSWRLTQYGDHQDEPLELIPKFREARAWPLWLDLDDPGLAEMLNDALYVVERGTADSGDGETVRFRFSDGRGVEVLKELTFRRGEYLVDIEIRVSDRGRPLSVALALGPGFAAQEQRDGRSNYYYASQSVWNQGGRVQRTKRGKLSDEGGTAGGLRWAGLEDQFFAALVLPDDPSARVRWRHLEQTPLPLSGVESGEEPEVEKEPVLAVGLPGGTGRLYVGPKQYQRLKALGSELEKAVWFSTYPWLAAIVRQIYLGLLWIYAHTVQNYGVAIVLATLVLRLVLFPVNQYSMVSMKKTQMQMQKLQPKIKAIRAKYKKVKDAQGRAKMNQDMMDLYKREGVNPMGGVTGCLPLLAQFPILIGFYNMLTVAVELRGAPFFGWIQDLSVKDPFWITPLLMGLTMFVQQRMAMTRVKDPQMQQQQRIMMFMPIMFTFICLQMPSGLVLYWFVNNLLGMGQQWLVNRHTDKLAIAPQKA